jgi:hypothetical protein
MDNSKFNPYKNTNLSYICNKISEFRYLEAKWNFGIGEAVSNRTIKIAIKLLSTINLASHEEFNNLKINALPSTEGGVIISLGKGDEFIELVVNPNFTYDLIYEKGIGVQFEILQEVYDIPVSNNEELIKYFFKLCNSSEPYTLETTTSIEKDSQASPSRIMEEESLFSTWNVQWLEVEAYATTSPNFINQQLETHQCIV